MSQKFKSSLSINRPPIQPRSVNVTPSAPPVNIMPSARSFTTLPRHGSTDFQPSRSFSIDSGANGNSLPSSTSDTPIILPRRASSKKGSLSSLSNFTVGRSCLTGATSINHLNEKKTTKLSLVHCGIGIACLVVNVLRYTQDLVHVLAVEGMALGGVAIFAGGLGIVCCKKPHRVLIVLLLAVCLGLLTGAIMLITRLIWLVLIHVTTWRVKGILFDVCVFAEISVSMSLVVLCCKALCSCCGSKKAKTNVTAGGQTFTITINTSS